MRNKKIIIFIIVVILALTIGVIYIVTINKSAQQNNNFFDNKQSSQLCAGEGATISSCVGCKTKCCPGLKPVQNSIIDGKCIFFIPMGSPGQKCINCGNGICDEQYSENNCNCPEDCK